MKRKFLLDSRCLQTILQSKLKVKKINIVKFYVKITKFEEITYKKTGKKLILQLKNKLLKSKEKSIISKAQFFKAKKNHIAQISKTRYIFKLKNLPCSVDIYNNDLRHICIFSVKFDLAEGAAQFSIPSFISKHLKKEITLDSDYYDIRLAIFGQPNFHFDSKNTMKIIEKSDQLKLFFPANIRTYDAVKIILFQLFHQIMTQKDNNNSKEYLENLYILFVKNLIIIKYFGDSIDELTANKFIQIFTQITDKIEQTINLNHKKTSQHHTPIATELTNYINSTEFESIMQEWKLILNDDSDFYIGNSNKNIKSASAYVIRSLCLKLIHHILKSYHYKKTIKTLIELIFMIDFFGDLFEIQQINIQHKLNKLLYLYKFHYEYQKDTNENIEINLMDKINKNNQKIVKKLHRLSQILKIFYLKEF